MVSDDLSEKRREAGRRGGLASKGEKKSEAGRKGGKAKVKTKGFGSNPELAREAAKKRHDASQK